MVVMVGWMRVRGVMMMVMMVVVVWRTGWIR